MLHWPKKSLVMPFYYINFDQNGPPYFTPVFYFSKCSNSSLELQQTIPVLQHAAPSECLRALWKFGPELAEIYLWVPNRSFYFVNKPPERSLSWLFPQKTFAHLFVLELYWARWRHVHFTEGHSEKVPQLCLGPQPALFFCGLKLFLWTFPYKEKYFAL